jgi:hypothetical protein
MMVLVPFKSVVFVLGLLSGLVFAGFIGSSLLEGKAPFAVDSGETRRAVLKDGETQQWTVAAQGESRIPYE